MKLRSALVLAAVLAAVAVSAQEPAQETSPSPVMILPESHRPSTLWTDPSAPNTFLRFLSESGRTRDDARIGVELPLLGVGGFRLFGSGFVHLVMLPKNATFSVDRFHAGLACGLGWSAQEWAVTLAPLYHESAHLADGYSGDVKADRKVLSRESLQSEISWSRKGFLAVLKGDWWWHSIRIRYRWNCGAGVQYEGPVFGAQDFVCGPAFSAFGYFLNRDWAVSFNYELSAGVFFRSSNRLLRVCWTTEDRDGLGQDFSRRITSSGLEIGYSIIPGTGTVYLFPQAQTLELGNK